MLWYFWVILVNLTLETEHVYGLTPLASVENALILSKGNPHSNGNI